MFLIVIKRIRLGLAKKRTLKIFMTASSSAKLSWWASILSQVTVAFVSDDSGIIHQIVHVSAVPVSRLHSFQRDLS